MGALNSVGNAARFGVSNVNSLTIGGNDSIPYAGIGYNINFDSGNSNQYFAVGTDRTSLIRFANGGFEFKGFDYWSSSETDPLYVWAQNFKPGSTYWAYKNNVGYVRAIRAF